MFDGTFGGGGHSIKLLQQHPNMKVLGTDLDYNVLSQCKLEYADLIQQRRLALCHSNYVNIPSIDLRKEFKRKITTKSLFDIGLLDLGFSSYQLEDIDRGFSYMPHNDEGTLDMRFDSTPDSPYASASDILNHSSEYELVEIFRLFGEEKFSTVLAQKLIEMRQENIIGTTGDFREIIKAAFPNSSQSEKSKVIRRAFQAIRISVNQEILNLRSFLESCPEQFMDSR
jgi:16S rRNA (cytosine1402-N4)-methyltransferase